MVNQRGVRSIWPKVVGVGPGDPELLTIKALNIIKSADVVVGSRRALEVVRDLIINKPIVEVDVSKTENFYSKISELREGETEGMVVLSTGDPMVAGMAKLFPDSEVVPGVSAFQLCAARIRREIVNSAVISCRYTRSYHLVASLLKLGVGVFVYPEPEASVGQIMSTMISNGVPEFTRCGICINLGLEDEEILKGTLGELRTNENRGLIVIFVEPPVV